MPPSQLKSLKASLREQGLVGPQKSKKKRKQNVGDGGVRRERNEALQGIRDRFNPFEVRDVTRRDKYGIVSSKDGRPALGRPGVTKGLGEERRRATLLKEIHGRNRVGKIVDKRIGEDDSTLTPEQRAAERFARQNERHAKKRSVFNLEDDIGDAFELTHGGRSIGVEDLAIKDDFEPGDVGDSDNEDFTDHQDDLGDSEQPSKRMRLAEPQSNGTENTGPLGEHRKSRQEVMEEVMSKSKHYKLERQRAKEDDDDLRAQLDKGLPDFLRSLQSYQGPPPDAEPQVPINPDRAALIAGKSREEADLQYNKRVRELAQDPRSKPSTRTKTEDELAGERASRLHDLEEARLRRMRGDEVSDQGSEAGDEEEDYAQDDADVFGLSQPADAADANRVLDVEEEDEFVLDDDLIAGDSEAEPATDQEESSEEEQVAEEEDDDDDDFIEGLVLPPNGAHDSNTAARVNGMASQHLSFTYDCPQTHSQLLKITENVENGDIPIVVQRIRALHHPRLAAENKEKLAAFSQVLLEHIVYLAGKQPRVPATVLESLLRHLHSLAKAYPSAVSGAFRSQLREITEQRPLELGASDFVLLTGVSSIFPTSDHFHSVVTPAMLILTRFLAYAPRSSLIDLVKGAYCCTLVLQYQSISKRYIPELVPYIQHAISILTGQRDAEAKLSIGQPVLGDLSPHRLPSNPAEPGSSLDFGLLYSGTHEANASTNPRTQPKKIKATLLLHFLTLLSATIDLYSTKSSFPEIFSPALILLTSLLQPPQPSIHQDHLVAITTLHNHLRHHRVPLSLTARLPLLLHSHRPLPIKTHAPKLDPLYQPSSLVGSQKYRASPPPQDDPATIALLRAQHKREHKGALRELRKDAAFVAREQLRRKRETDEAHERKMRRVVAEIQSQEGQAGGMYERQRERERRKRK